MSKDDKFAMNRRSVIKWSLFAGAALGLPRWKVFEVLEGTHGKAYAAEASCSPVNRSVHIHAGNGGLAWFQLLWPHVDVAAAANPNFAFHEPGQDKVIAGTDKPLRASRQAPWQTLPGNRQVSVFMCDQNRTHTNAVGGAIATNVNAFSAIAALQSVSPTLVPIIAVDDVSIGVAPAAPRPSRVANAGAVVELFNSVASRAGGLLSDPSDAVTYEANYKGFLALRAAANRPTMNSAFSTGKVASNLLSRNLASQLQPSTADYTRYGIDQGTQTKIRDIATTLIITAKAFSMGLTNSVVFPALRDDPHGAFNNMQNLVTTVTQLGKVLDSFYADLSAVDDPTCAGAKVADNTVISIHGDTPKDPLSRPGWQDGTPRNSNWIYVLGAGMLRTGWHGGVLRDGTAQGYNPATGQNDPNRTSASLLAPGMAAIAYAVAKGDMRRVQEYYNGEPIDGIVRPIQL